MVRSPVAARGTNNDDASASILGRGARVRGRVGGDGDLRVEGQIEGDVAISGELTIEEGAAVTGDVGASAVVVAGALTGDVSARGPVAIRASAKVEGNMGGAEVSLDEGASFHGRKARRTLLQGSTAGNGRRDSVGGGHGRRVALASAHRLAGPAPRGPRPRRRCIRVQRELVRKLRALAPAPR